MHVRWIAASVFVALAGPAFAQSKAVLGKDDVAFAVALKRFGYPELAERLLQTIQKEGTLGPEEAIAAKGLQIDLRQDLALRETDPLKRLELLREILEQKESLIEQYKGREVAEEARGTLPDLYRTLGDAVSAAISRESDTAKIAELQKIGTETYTKAEDSMRQRIEQLKQELETKESPELQGQLSAASYNLPRMMYFHALLYPKEEFRRKDLLNQAVKGFQLYSLDFNDSLWNYEGLILEGLCHKELDEMEDAQSAFQDAFRFPEKYFEKDSKGYWPLSKEMADTVSEACLQWMNLLAEQKKSDKVIALGKEYMETTPGALEARRGLAILASMAETYLALDDTKAANDAADKMIEADRGGPWGAKGREIQGRTLGAGKVDPVRALAIAKAYGDRGEDQRALQLAHQALASLKGHPDESKIGADIWLFIGSMFARRDLDHEAALAFDMGAERYPRADQAPELIYQAIREFQTINSKEQRPYYKRQIDERVKKLATTYPNSDRAQGSITIEADQAMLDRDYLTAADQYARVLPSSRLYLDAQAKAGEAYLKHAVETLKDKPAEAKTYLDQAETLLKKVLSEVNAKLKDMVDPNEVARLQNIAIRTLTRLSELYLTTNRPADVLPLLEGVDDRFAGNADALNYFWGFRIRALEMQGRLDEAIARLDALAKKDPKSKAIAGAARLVAQSLDQKGQDLRRAGKLEEADPVQKRAAQYYAMAGRALLAGEGGRIAEVELIANRLFVLAMNINQVPEEASSFIGWDPKKTTDAELYQIAADLFESALRQSPNYRSQVTLGKIYGFLQKWDQATSTFAELFDNEKLLDVQNRKINVGLARQKGELLMALFEWGVAEHMLANSENSSDRYRRAQMIFDALEKTFTPLGWNWWQNQFYRIKNKADMGNYLGARADLNELVRTTNNLGKDYGLEPEFNKLKKQLESK